MSIKDSLSNIKKIIIEHTDECFFANIETDSGGVHFTVYLVADAINLSKFRKNLYDANLKKRLVVVYDSRQSIMEKHNKLKE